MGDYAEPSHAHELVADSINFCSDNTERDIRPETLGQVVPTLLVTGTSPKGEGMQVPTCDADLEEIVAEEVEASLSVMGADERGRAQLARIASRMCFRVGHAIAASGTHQAGECVLSSERVTVQAQHPAAISLELMLRRFGNREFGLKEDCDETGTLVGVAASLVDVLAEAKCDDSISVTRWWSEFGPDDSTCFRLCDRYGWRTRGSDSPALWEEPQPESQQERLAVRLLTYVQLYRYKFSQRWADIRELEHRAHSSWQADPYVALVASIARIPDVGDELAAVEQLRMQWERAEQSRVDQLPTEVLRLEFVGAARVVRTSAGAQALKELIEHTHKEVSDSSGVPGGVWTPLHLAVATRKSVQELELDERVKRVHELEHCLKLLSSAQANLPGDGDFARAMEALVASERTSVESDLQTLRLIERTKSASETIVEKTRSEMTALEDDIETRMRDHQLRSVEVLGIFSAAVAFAVAVPTLIVQGTGLTSERLFQLSAILGAVLLGFAVTIPLVANTLRTGTKFAKGVLLVLAASIVAGLIYVIAR